VDVEAARETPHQKEVCMSVHSLRLMQRSLATLALIVFSVVGVASAACVGDSPEAVLKCYAEAHELRDIGALEELLASDYVWVAVSPHRAHLVERGTTLEASRGMFTDPRAESVSVTFADGYDVVDGDDPDTWRIEGVLLTLSVKMESVTEPHAIATSATYYVRKAPATKWGYEIYREVTFEGVTFTSE
jgi:hypothetical protein